MSRARNTAFTSLPYPGRMATFLLRVVLPDRPGALGAVASRIGAVRADVVAVDIVGRGSGRAVDEFVVDLADERHVSLLLDEIAEVDGVAVEEVRMLPAVPADRRLSAYDTAAALMGERTPGGVLRAVAARARAELDAAWSAVLDVEDAQVLAADGPAPAAPWLAAYVAGTRWFGAPAASRAPAPCGEGDADAPTADAPTARSADLPAATGTTGPAAPPGAHAPAPDVAWAPLVAWDLVLIAGRPGRPLAEVDRRHLSGIAGLADARWADLADRDARGSHPSARRAGGPGATTALDRAGAPLDRASSAPGRRPAAQPAVGAYDSAGTR